MLLADFIRRFDTQPTETADGYLLHCPAHADSHESLRVTVSDEGKVLVRCRAGCQTADVMRGLGLNMRDLAAMEPGDVSFRATPASTVPVGPAEIAALRVKLDGWAARIANIMHGTDPAIARGYAEDRFGIMPDDARRLGLGLATDLGGGPRLVVPFRDPDGVARGFQARALAPDAAVRWLGPANPESGGTWAKLGWFPGSAGWDEVLVCEGPGDALTAAALGYDAVGIRGAGLASVAEVADQLAAWLKGRVAVVAGDGDVSGRRFTSTLASELVERGIIAKILNVPDGEDLTSWRDRDRDQFPREIIRAILEAEEATSARAALTARDVERYPLTDLGNARYVRDFITARGSGVRCSPETGFYLLDAGVWRPDKLELTRSYVQDAAEAISAIAKALLENAGADSNLIREAKGWDRWARYSQSMNGINAALRELQALRGVATDVNDFDQHPHLLACRNGVVNLRTGDLGPHDPSLLLTRRVELDYDPAAAAPRWEQFLTEVFPGYEDSLPAYVRRLVGYGITGSTAEQCFVVLWGTGANGKSVFTDTLSEVFRELTVTTPFSTFEDRQSGGIPNDLAALKGARLVMAAEGEQGKPMAEAILKRVTGRDLISARFMRREFFEFRPSFLLMLATNFKPAFKGQDEGLWRRVKLIPWARYFADHERDHRLGDKLLAEASGIFTWAVRGAGEWFSSGLGDPTVVRTATRNYRETSDVLAGFFPGLYVADPGGRVVATDLFRTFQEWADEHNMLDLKRWSSRAFYGALEERGLSRKKSNGRQFVYGLRRARQTDRVPDHDVPEDGRADPAPLADSSSVTPTISGPSLDDAL